MFGHPRNGTTRQGYRFHVDFNTGCGDTGLYMLRRTGPDSSVFQYGEVVWKDHPQYERCPESFHADTETMQELFNALWAYGFRPNESVTPDAMSAAHTAHIEDLRNICTKLLDKV